MPRSSRVCLDLTPLETLDRHGGIGRYGVYLLEQLAAMSRAELGPLEIYAAVSSSESPLPAQDALRRARELPPEITHAQYRKQRSRALGPLLGSCGVDLFHSITPYYAPKLTRGVQIATVHDVIAIVMPKRRGLPHARQWLRHRWHFLPFTHFLADTERTRLDMISALRVTGKPITVVHLGVDTRVFSKRAEADVRALLRRTDLPEKFFLCVSSDHYRKNHKTLFDAWCRVADRIDEGLVFVGRQLYRSTFNEIRVEVERRGLQSRFRWYSDVDDAELPALYQRATAAVAPSRYEGFGLTVLEAMACGTPVIAARNGAYDEVAGGAAELFGPEDRAGLERQLVRLASDPAMRSSLTERGTERVRHLSWRSCAEHTLDVYRRVLRV